MGQPFFSIIVVAYNAEQLIGKTIESILQQDFQDYEIVVKDACSTDKTLENVPRDERIRVYSTKDKGIYDGMNEAIGYAKGKYCTFLNCGDMFHSSDVLQRVYDRAKTCDPKNTIVYGDIYKYGSFFKQPGQVTMFYLYRNPLNHQSMFFGTELFTHLGLYDTQLKICADHEFTIRAFKAGVRLVYCPVTVCDYLGGGASESEKGMQIWQNDRKIIADRHYTYAQRKKYDFLLALSMKGLRRWLVSSKSPRFVRKAYRKLVNLINR